MTLLISFLFYDILIFKTLFVTSSYFMKWIMKKMNNHIQFLFCVVLVIMHRTNADLILDENASKVAHSFPQHQLNCQFFFLLILFLSPLNFFMVIQCTPEIAPVRRMNDENAIKNDTRKLMNLFSSLFFCSFKRK